MRKESFMALLALVTAYLIGVGLYVSAALVLFAALLTWAVIGYQKKRQRRQLVRELTQLRRILDKARTATVPQGKVWELFAGTCTRTSEAVANASLALLREDLKAVRKYLDVANGILEDLPVDVFAELFCIDEIHVKPVKRRRQNALGETFEQLPER